MREEELRRNYEIQKKKKQKRAREQFLLMILLLVLIPVILSVILFIRQNKMQKSLEALERKMILLHTESDSEDAAPDASGKNTNPDAQLPATGEKTDVGGELSQPGFDETGQQRGETEQPKDSGSDTVPDPMPENEPTPTSFPTVDADGNPLPWADKKVYLTFDDGPSTNTDALLDLLGEYGYKATFFVIGKTDEESLRLYKRMAEEGHTVGMHSYTHDYDKIYKSVEDFEKDFTKISNLLYDTIGYVPDLYRFPGGSSNSKCRKLTIQPFIHFLQEKNMRYFDWNVENGDATGVSYTVEELAANITDVVAQKGTSVVLCHDTAAKTKTLQSMEIVLKVLKEKGAQVLPITEDTPMVRHVKPANE